MFLLLFIWGLYAATPRVAEKVLEKYNIIWGFDFINENEIILTEKNGSLFYVNLKTKKKTPIKNVPAVNTEGQGGLLDVKLHYDFPKNKWVYLTYSYFEENKGHTRLLRAKLEKNELKNIEVLFTAMPLIAADVHYGSRITFDHKGHVFFGIGERNDRHRAQDLNTHYGKVIRLHEDGSIPKDNPFVGQKDKRPEIWSYGHRNPQGIFYDLETNELWLSEHGPQGGDEINLIQKGQNYGWPVVTYGREYWGPKIGEGTSKAGMMDPVYYYVPSIAPATLYIYKGNKYPEWKNSFFQGSLKLLHLNRLNVTNRKQAVEERLFQDQYGRIRHVAESPSGILYFSTDSGEMYLIK